MSEYRKEPALFERFPALAGRVAWVKLGNFPTRIRRMKKLGKAIGAPFLYVKREDESGPLYGGNKIRKLEFSLAHAIEQKKSTIVTFGGAGSNHVLATTIYGSTLGLKTAAFLIPQPPSTYVSRNIRAYCHYGTELHYLENASAYPRNILSIARRVGSNGYFLPPGGSNIRGTLGFVDAAFEIKKQLEEDGKPMPKRIYIAAGSGGTMAGLMVGAKLAGLTSDIIGVRVADRYLVNPTTIGALANAVAKFLHKTDASIPKLEFKPKHVMLREEYFGGAYGRFTPEGREAMKMVEELEGMHIEGTYTGKTFAALLDDLKKDPEMPALFMNTYNSVDIFSSLPHDCDTSALPKGMRGFILED